ncbi:MAG: hypothetical protein ACLTK8_01210 [Paeniclostridium sp.]
MYKNEDYNDKFMNYVIEFSDANTINLCNLGDNNTQMTVENLQSRQNYIELDPAKDPKEPNKDSDKKDNYLEI